MTSECVASVECENLEGLIYECTGGDVYSGVGVSIRLLTAPVKSSVLRCVQFSRDYIRAFKYMYEKIEGCELSTFQSSLKT